LEKSVSTDTGRDGPERVRHETLPSEHRDTRHKLKVTEAKIKRGRGGGGDLNIQSCDGHVTTFSKL